MIDVAIEHLHERTVYIAQNINDVESDDLIRLIGLRNRAMKVLEKKEIVLDEEKQMIKDILSYDEIIVGKMNAIKEDAALNLRKISQYHIQNNAYGKVNSSSPYASRL